MIRDITIGQYYPEYSIIHKLDSRLKIVMTVLFIASIFVVNDFVGYSLVVAALVAVIIASRVPFKFIVRGLKPIVIIIAFTFMLHILMTSGTVIWEWKFIKITEEGLYNAGFMATRLILIILGASMLTLTTKPMKLTDGIESLLNPFRRFGLPAHELAMMMGIALRFIPTLLDETDKIMKAQMSRGADFESGNIIKKAKAMVPMLVPLFVSAFRIAQDLAMAMEARCYRGGEGRTKLHALKFRRKDVFATCIGVLYLGGIICMRIFL